MTLLEKWRVVRKIEGMEAQLVEFGIVEGQRCKIVLDLTPQTGRDGLQHLCQIEVSDNCIVDLKQNPRTVSRQTKG